MIITIVPNQIFPLQKIIRKRHLLHHSGFHQQETDPGLNLWMTLMQILVILQHLLLIRILKMIKVMPKLMIRIIQGMYSEGRENIVWYFWKDRLWRKITKYILLDLIFISSIQHVYNIDQGHSFAKFEQAEQYNFAFLVKKSAQNSFSM